MKFDEFTGFTMMYDKCQVHNALLYISCRMGCCYGCIKFEFNDILLYTKNNYKQRRYVQMSDLSGKYIL